MGRWHLGDCEWSSNRPTGSGPCSAAIRLLINNTPGLSADSRQIDRGRGVEGEKFPMASIVARICQLLWLVAAQKQANREVKRYLRMLKHDR